MGGSRYGSSRSERKQHKTFDNMGHGGQQKCGFRTFGRKAKSVRKVAASSKPTKLKKSISPGTVLILLAGRFRGRRVVFLKQLASGLLAVTGPYAINGVPLRRVNQKFCIATSLKVDLKGANVSSVNDEYFARGKEAKKSKSESSVFAT